MPSFMNLEEQGDNMHSMIQFKYILGLIWRGYRWLNYTKKNNLSNTFSVILNLELIYFLSRRRYQDSEVEEALVAAEEGKQTAADNEQKNESWPDTGCSATFPYFCRAQ